MERLRLLFLPFVFMLLCSSADAVTLSTWNDGDTGATVRAAIQGNDTALNNFVETIDTEAELKSLYNLEDDVDFYTTSTLDTMLLDYVTASSLTTTLGDYVLTSALATATVQTAGELSPTKESGVAGYFELYEEDTTNELVWGWRGPSDLSVNISNMPPNAAGTIGQAFVISAVQESQTLESGKTGTLVTYTNTTVVPTDDGYGPEWNGDTTEIPSKDDIYDKIESLSVSASTPTVQASDPTIASSTGYYIATNDYHYFWNEYGIRTVDLTAGALDDSDTSAPVGVADADGTHSGTEDSITSGIDWTEPYLDVSTVACTVVNATPTSPEITCIGNACDTEPLTPDGTDTVTCTWAADDLAGNSATGTDLVQAFTYSGGGGSYLVNEDFSGTGSPSGWSTYDQNGTGTIDWDYGSPEQLRLVADTYFDTRAIWPTHTATSTISGKIVFTVVNLPTDSMTFIAVQDASENILAYIQINASYRLNLYHGTAVDYGTSAETLSASTEYVIEFDYASGTGSDGTMDLYLYESSGSKPETPNLTITTGTSTADVTHGYVQADRSIECTFALVQLQ